MIRRLLLRHNPVQVDRVSETDPALAELRGHARISQAHARAAELGFRLLGAARVEGLLIEVHYHEGLATALELSATTYVLRTRLQSGELVLTCGHEDPILARQAGLSVQGTRGKLQDDLRSHERVLSARESAPRPIECFNDYLADVRRFHEQDAPLRAVARRAPPQLLAVPLCVGMLGFSLVYAALGLPGHMALGLAFLLSASFVGLLALPNKHLLRIASERARSQGFATLEDKWIFDLEHAVRASKPAELERIQGGDRCPACSEAVGLYDLDVTGCTTCGARHHEGCWPEGASCGSCGGASRYQRRALEVPVRLPWSLASDSQRALLGGAPGGVIKV